MSAIRRSIDDAPPLGALEAAQQLGRDEFPNLVVFNSLSKRSNAPGLRSGAVPVMRRCSSSSCCIAPIMDAR